MMLAGSDSRFSGAVARRAFRFYVAIALPIIIIVTIGVQLDHRAERSDWEKNQEKFVATVKTELALNYFSVLTDLQLISDDRALFSGSKQSNELLAQKFERLARIGKSYHQLRFIGSDGREIVRVNYSDGVVTRTAVDALQNKSNRPYFQVANKIKENEVYISRFDLNVERGGIEKPIRPVIRFVIPVFSRNGERKGVLVLNYLGGKLLHLLSVYDNSNPGKLFLLNEDGYFLYSGDPSKNWGFQREAGERFSESYSKWEFVVSNSTGTALGDEGMFAVESLGRFSQKDIVWLKKYSSFSELKIYSEEQPWRIVSLVDRNVLYADSDRRSFFVLSIVAGILIILIPLSLYWGRSRQRALDMMDRDRLYSQVVSQSEELIYITDLEGVIQFVNPAVEKNTGYTKSELIGKRSNVFKSGRQSEVFYKALWGELKAGRTYQNIFINKCKDGDLYYEMKIITPLRDNDGVVQYYVSTGRDITSFRDMCRRELDISDTMTGGVSHHFGNMLSIIKGYSQMALSKLGGQPFADNELKVEEYLAQIENASLRAENLLANVRNVSGREFQNKSPVDLGKVLSKTVSHWVSMIGENREVEIFVEPELPALRCDKDAVMNAVIALLDNAKDATPEDGEISVSLKAERIQNETCVTCGEPLFGDFEVISVSNSGKGIPKEISGKIWDPFFSTKETSLLVGVSPGLGLSSVRTMVHGNGGHILLESSDRKGTVVRLVFSPEKFEVMSKFSRSDLEV